MGAAVGREICPVSARHTHRAGFGLCCHAVPLRTADPADALLCFTAASDFAREGKPARGATPCPHPCSSRAFAFWDPPEQRPTTRSHRSPASSSSKVPSVPRVRRSHGYGAAAEGRPSAAFLPQLACFRSPSPSQGEPWGKCGRNGTAILPRSSYCLLLFFPPSFLPFFLSFPFIYFFIWVGVAVRDGGCGMMARSLSELHDHHRHRTPPHPSLPPPRPVTSRAAGIWGGRAGAPWAGGGLSPPRAAVTAPPIL